MPHYELLYLVSNEFSEEELNPIKEKVESMITGNGGTITLKQSLGKKRLAYKIKQFRHGYYELLEFDAPAEALPKINEQIRLASDILRHQTLKCEPKTKEQLEKEARIMSELATSKKEQEASDAKQEKPESKPEAQPEIKSEAKTVETSEVAEAKTETKTKAEAKKTPAETAKADENKVELSDLDDKLNQILDTDNLL